MTYRIWAGSGKLFCKKPIRMWTIPKQYSIAFPTKYFYKNRYVILSNEGNELYHNWVALDRYNDENWLQNELTINDCIPPYIEKRI